MCVRVCLLMEAATLLKKPINLFIAFSLSFIWSYRWCDYNQNVGLPKSTNSLTSRCVPVYVCALSLLLASNVNEASFCNWMADVQVIMLLRSTSPMNKENFQNQVRERGTEDANDEEKLSWPSSCVLFLFSFSSSVYSQLPYKGTWKAKEAVLCTVLLKRRKKTHQS